MDLRNSKTRWFLVSPSPQQSEERHIWDVAFGLLCLEAAGIAPEDIEIFIDGKPEINLPIFTHASNHKYEIRTTSHLEARIAGNGNYDNLVMFFSGHGSAEGIAASQIIKPHWLAAHVKSAPNLKFGIIFLGQCYAGIFNHINTKPKLDNTKKPLEAELVLIGATNLCESLSISINEAFLKGHKQSWPANIFLAMVFNWFSRPFDIDGDGKNTIMDAFKFAGARANDQNKAAKTSGFTDVFSLYETLRRVNETLGQQMAITQEGRVTYSPQTLLQKHSLEKMINDHVNIRLTHPEPWVLNSWATQDIFFPLPVHNS